jgi:hypothetical protein
MIRDVVGWVEFFTRPNKARSLVSQGLDPTYELCAGASG